MISSHRGLITAGCWLSSAFDLGAEGSCVLLYFKQLSFSLSLSRSLSFFLFLSLSTSNQEPHGSRGVTARRWRGWASACFPSSFRSEPQMEVGWWHLSQSEVNEGGEGEGTVRDGFTRMWAPGWKPFWCPFHQTKSFSNANYRILTRTTIND